MKIRIRLTKNNKFVEFAKADIDKAKELRKTNPQFKWGRIKEILEVHPEQITLGKVYGN